MPSSAVKKCPSCKNLVASADDSCFCGFDFLAPRRGGFWGGVERNAGKMLLASFLVPISFNLFISWLPLDIAINGAALAGIALSITGYVLRDRTRRAVRAYEEDTRRAMEARINTLEEERRSTGRG